MERSEIDRDMRAEWEGKKDVRAVQKMDMNMGRHRA